MAIAALLAALLLTPQGAPQARHHHRVTHTLSGNWQGYAKVTTYCPHCSGNTCADGSHVRSGICAASPNIPMHSTVVLEGIGELKVCDRGGLVKVGTVRWHHKSIQCTRAGETANFDRWVPHCAGGCWSGPGTRHFVRYRVVKVGSGR